MKTGGRFVATLVCTLTVAFAGIYALARWKMPPPASPLLSETIAPGKPIPPSSSINCSFPSCCGNSEHKCVVVATKLIFYYYPGDSVISEVVYIDRAYSIGELVGAWGEPIGVSGGNYCKGVYWSGGRYAYVCDWHFEPNSRAYAVWVKAVDKLPPLFKWRGFARQRS
jgi:hypothetical protein